MAHHAPFQSLGPVEWEDVPQDNFSDFLNDIFSEAQTVVNSIPSSTNLSPSTSSPPSLSTTHDQSSSGGRARAKTDSAVLNTANPNPSRSSSILPRQRTPAAVEQAQKIQKDWKEIKLNAKDNPLDVHVYKLGSKDGKGAWFARRSLHEGLSFDQWKDGMQREFVETMKVQGHPGSGSIRGIGADKRVENHEVPDCGHVQVFQLSAQFPGPTSPRDFITLLLTSETPQPIQESSQPLRQFMIVSKPCVHSECPPRQGIIRGQYESVEFIREIPAKNPVAQRSWSSTDLSSPKESNPSSRPLGSSSSDNEQSFGAATTIEWLMVTRSDPGGSVPRFMIEKGTPPGIVNDAGKFLTWLKTKPADDSDAVEAASAVDDNKAPTEIPAVKKTTSNPKHESLPDSQATLIHDGAGDDAYWSNGVLGMITGAFEAASSVVTGGLRQFNGSQHGHNESVSSSQRHEETEGDSTPSETSSIHSFTSALEGSITDDINNKDQDSLRESQSDDRSQDNLPPIKELKRLEERRRKLDEKAAKLEERLSSKKQGDKERDAAALAKAREKHEREIAKHEAKYKRELRKLEEKREQEERKAEERRKKIIEREEKSNITLELEKTRTERDIAKKQAELLKVQVGELQAQNTMLVARLGKLNGEDRPDSAPLLHMSKETSR